MRSGCLGHAVWPVRRLGRHDHGSQPIARWPRTVLTPRLLAILGAAVSRAPLDRARRALDG